MNEIEKAFAAALDAKINSISAKKTEPSEAHTTSAA